MAANPRYFKPVSVAALKAKIEQLGADEGPRYLYEEVCGRDAKTKMDWENWSDSQADYGCMPLLGYHTLASGLTFYGVIAGGDWEHGVFVLFYVDPKDKLRAYVPTDGNPWNTTTKQAYGNDSEADLKNAKRRWPAAFKDKTEDDVEPGDFHFDPDLIRADINARLFPAPGPKPAGTGTRRPPIPDQLRARVEALTYYGTGAEDYELFDAACRFAYQLTGLGWAAEAAAVVGWAEEMAKATGPADALGPADSAKGYWG